MKPTQKHPQPHLPENHPLNVVTSLLGQDVTHGRQDLLELEPATARGVAILERSALETVRAARGAGVDIEYVGINPLFSDARFYEGEKTDWVMGPVDRSDDAIVPRQEAQDLRRLVGAGVEFPLLYVAHEVEQDRTAELRTAAASGRRELPTAKANELVGPAPPPPGSVEVGERLAQRTTKAVKAVKRAAVLGGTLAVGAVTAPVIALGAATASLDPVILGAIPALSEKAGAPAAWYVLARWEW